MNGGRNNKLEEVQKEQLHMNDKQSTNQDPLEINEAKVTAEQTKEAKVVEDNNPTKNTTTTNIITTKKETITVIQVNVVIPITMWIHHPQKKSHHIIKKNKRKEEGSMKVNLKGIWLISISLMILRNKRRRR